MIRKTPLDEIYEGRDYTTVYERTVGVKTPLVFSAKASLDAGTAGRLAVLDVYYPEYSPSGEPLRRGTEAEDLCDRLPSVLAAKRIELRGKDHDSGLYRFDNFYGRATVYRFFLVVPHAMSNATFGEAVRSIFERELESDRGLRRLAHGGWLGRGRSPETPARPRDAKPTKLFELRPESWYWAGA